MPSFKTPGGNKGKVLISTLAPLGGNYGGTLQAFALQKIITKLGHDVVTIDEKNSLPSPRFLLGATAHTIKSFLGIKQNLPLFPADQALIQRNGRRFIQENINTIYLHDKTAEAKRQYLRSCDAIVVGSDQVWRAPYANLKHQYLDYASGLGVTKISYAASFGRDDLEEYTQKQLEKAKTLIREFTAVSVRERSGVNLCKEYLCSQAEQHIDPTLLLHTEDYLSLLNGSTTTSDQTRSLFTYILGENEYSGSIVHKLEQAYQLQATRILPPAPTSRAQLRANPRQFELPQVQDWINNIANAEYVVTDSFHGTAFSILFNKPFIVLGNESRGLARIFSLLDQFGLNNRFLDVRDPIPECLNLPEPNWTKVNDTLASERARGLSYLASHLNGE